jgi:proteasome component ECM29
LVKDPVKSIEQFFDQIMVEVLKGMGDRMWRTREARFVTINCSCSALADLLHGKQLHQVQKYMTELWKMCFRTLDDIKESVRKAAFQTCKTLTNLTVRYANPTSSSLANSQKVMDEMIPFLLEKGLVNMAEEVRQFSLVTILKLCKTGGVLLSPHVCNITCTFLESLSSLEPQTMNYLSLNADKYNISQDMLDSTRLSAAKASPIMDAVDQCIQFINAKYLEDLIPRLCIIKRGIGLPTRAGTARFIYILIQKMPMDIRPYADVLVKALTGPIFDRSPPVRKSFSTALGHVCKLASPGAIDKLTAHLQTTYLDATEEEGRSVAPVTFLEMSRLAPSAVSEIHGVLLPLAFMGARDTTFPVLADIWAKVWEENTGGSTNAIKKWKMEIFDSLSAVLKTSPSWALKKQVGKGLVDFCKALGTDISEFVPQMLSLLVDSLAGRTWDGKEALVEALCTLSVEAKSFFASHQPEKVLVEDIFIREAKKNSINYRRLSVEYLGIAFDSLKSERYADIFPYLCEVAEDLIEKDDVDESIQKPMMLVVRGNAFKAIGYSFSPVGKNMDLADATALFLGKNLLKQVWNIRIAILEGLKKFLEKINRPSSPEALDALVDGILACLNDTKYRSVRDHSVKCLQSLVLSIGGVGGLNSVQLDSLKTVTLTERDNALQHDLKTTLKMDF